MKTKKENSKNFCKNNDGTDLRRLPLVQDPSVEAGDRVQAGAGGEGRAPGSQWLS